MLKIGKDILTNGSSYLDFVKKEQEYKQSSRYLDDKSYWENVFSSIPEIATIPSTESNSSASYEANRLAFNLDKELLNKIDIFCKDNHLSFFNFFISIFAIYINRVSNVDDFVIGTPILNRTSINDKTSTGMFVNTVPVRFNFLENTSFNDFVKIVSKNIIGILRHQKYSYNTILEDIRSKFNNTPNLYNIMFSYQLTKAYDKSIGNYKTNWGFNNCSSNDIAIHIYDINDTGEIEVNYDYLISKYSKQDISDLHQRILHIISQIVENLNVNLNDIDIVTLEEKNKILYEFNNTSTEYSKDKTIIALFEEQVDKTPDNIAVVFEDQQLTFKELNEKANSLAYYLRFEKKVARNDFVGIMVNRSLEMIISILAVLKSGAAYIPIDPTYPKDRIDYMLKNSNAKILLTQDKLKNKVDFKNNVLVDLQNSEIYKDNFRNLEHINKCDDTSYVIFTSGSTGNPKGVVLNHKALSNLTNYCNHYIEYLKTPNNMAIVSITTVSFDIFIFETLISLQRGLKLIIANENEQNSPYLLSNLIQKYDIKVIQSTPSRMQIFFNNKEEMPYLSNLDYITLAGEQLPLKLVQDLSNLCGATIYNGYGPSETTVFSTLTKMNTDKITIGRPLDNTQIYILDTNKNVLPTGISGEIYISGDGVGKGYLNNKELTDKSFINNPFIENSIMYKTGDIGFFNASGEITCLGRSDNQVKLRGLRIELGEIENKISSLSSINSCVVIKKSDALHEYLCAYFTSNVEVNVKDIEKYLGQFLPKYMIPKYFVQIKELPYTPNGKIDRKALSKINYIKKEASTKDVRNEYDIKLIEILKNILHIESISIEDDFLELGGDSLSAITLSSYVQREFGVQIYVKDILNNSTICDLSDLIANNSSTSQIKIKPISKSSSYNASSAQKRIYFASQIDGSDSLLYNVPGGIIFEKELDSEKLEKCIYTIIQHQESLRTYFEVENENVVQKIKDNIDFKLDVLENEDFENINSIFNDFVKPFDLSKAPLFRVKYLKFTNKKTAIFFDMHHIISDGASLSIFADEFIKLYNNISLPALTITYKDFAAYENEKLNTHQFEDAKNYWINQFKDEIPVLNMPTQFSRPSSRTFTGKKIHSLIDKPASNKIKKLCDSLEITPYMFLLSCYYILLSKYTSQDDIVVGSPIVGRDLAETYNIIGMFVNTLALRNKIDSTCSFKDFVLSIKKNLLSAFKYQTYPFDELVKDLNITRDTSRNPLFDTLFTYQNNGYKEIILDGSKAEYYTSYDIGISKFDLSVEIIPNNEEFNLIFEYSTNLFENDFIKNMSNHYLNIINNVISNIETKIDDIAMLSPEEKNKILYEFNNTSTEYPKDKTIIALFEEQVDKTPDNIAVVFEDQQLTFKELNEKANSLAYYLKNTLHIKNNDIIGVMVNRSLEVIISILAILKSGGAYIPIDPTFPQERVTYMLSNSNAKVLLSKNKLLNKINFKNVVSVDLENNNIYNLPNTNLNNSNMLEDLMYVIYTSGSTGKPKGVMITHKVFINFTNYCNNYVKYLKHPFNHSIVSITTISFDIFAYETLISLQKGLKVVLANENEQTTPHLLNALMEKNNVDIIQSTPSIMQIFINNLSTMPALRKIKYAILAGEQLPLNLVKDLHNLSNIVVYNGYGPSETYYCTLTEVNDNIVTIGNPISNSQIYILDKNLKPVPVGVIGEIYISGDCVGKGYLNNASLTNKSFIPNPFLNGVTMYKSGDLGKYLKNGTILCLGRSDHQIKIRGLRIELQEIESVMMKYPNIQKVAVVKQEIKRREFISAYYVSNKRISIPNFRKYLSNYLPSYMIPSYYTVLDDLPYTPNGKIDKKLLPVPSEIKNTSKIAYQPPQSDLQNQLVEIFQKVLNTKPIGIYDNFFELGGDSLLAMNLNMELSKFTNKITYQDIFRFPTVSELEQIIITNNKNSLYSKVEDLPDGIMNILSNTQKREFLKKNHKKNVLLTGSTGFLGIHILEQLLCMKDINIYCLIRPETGLTPETKLKQKLNYYFGDKYNHMINKKIFIINGDICKPNFGLSGETLLDLTNNVDIIVNSAANVSHFGIYNDFYKTNVLSVKYMIDFCKKYNKKLYHISTIGVSGLSLDKSYLTYKNKHKVIFDESSLYIGQEPETVYSYTKFQAELQLLNEISKGLDAYILRMGNLMPRYRDGKFQENASDNEFINKLISFIKIGILPDYLENYPLEFTPVDYAAKAICKVLTNYTKTNRVFHLYNNKTVPTEKCLKLLHKLGYDVNILKEKDFVTQINKMLKNEDSKTLINYLLNDFDKNTHIDYKTNIAVKSSFSKKYLRKMFFFWPKISKKYLIRFFDILKEVM